MKSPRALHPHIVRGDVKVQAGSESRRLDVEADKLQRQLVDRLRDLLERSGLTRAKLAELSHYDPSSFSRAVSGKRLPTATIAAACDEAFGTGSEIADLRERVVQLRTQARRERKAERGARLPAGTSEAGHRQPAQRTVLPRDGEVGATDRRDALRVLGVGTTIAALGPVAADLSRRIAQADPDPLSVDQTEAQIHRVAAVYRVTPHVELVNALAPQWHHVEDVLRRPVSPAVRARLTIVAGQHAFYLGTLAFDLGDDDTARSLLRLAGQRAAHAKEMLPARSPRRSDVHLLEGSVAAMRSSVAYFTGAYAEAADIAAQARKGAHPFARPILAGCEARAAALARRPGDARLALADMEATVWEGEVMPGPNPGGPSFVQGFLGGTLAHLGDGVAAEPFARTSLDLRIAENPDHFVQIGGAYTTLCRTYLRRPEPDPDRAADAATKALLVLDGRPTRGVVQNADQMWHQMHTRWPEHRAVQELGEIIVASRRALPALSSDTTAA